MELEKEGTMIDFTTDDVAAAMGQGAFYRRHVGVERLVGIVFSPFEGPGTEIHARLAILQVRAPQCRVKVSVVAGQ